MVAAALRSWRKKSFGATRVASPASMIAPSVDCRSDSWFLLIRTRTSSALRAGLAMSRSEIQDENRRGTWPPSFWPR